MPSYWKLRFLTQEFGKGGGEGQNTSIQSMTIPNQIWRLSDNMELYQKDSCLSDLWE